MIISPVTSSVRSRERAITPGRYKRAVECVKERDNIKQNSYDNINTSIKSNPDARVNFKGNIPKEPLAHKVFNLAYYKPIVLEGAFAGVITCGARPATIMWTAKDDEEKDKCAYQAAKSISSGVVGFAMSVAVGSTIGLASKKASALGTYKMPEEMKKQSLEIVKKGVDALKEYSKKIKSEHPQFAEQINKFIKDDNLDIKFLEKQEKNGVQKFKDKVKTTAPDIFEIVDKAIYEQISINKYAGTNKNIADKLFQPVFSPLRAYITITSIPPILKALGLKKPDTAKNESANPDMYQNFNGKYIHRQNKNSLFQTFYGARHENQQH